MPRRGLGTDLGGGPDSLGKALATAEMNVCSKQSKRDPYAAPSIMEAAFAEVSATVSAAEAPQVDPRLANSKTSRRVVASLVGEESSITAIRIAGRLNGGRSMKTPLPKFTRVRTL